MVFEGFLKSFFFASHLPPVGRLSFFGSLKKIFSQRRKGFTLLAFFAPSLLCENKKRIPLFAGKKENTLAKTQRRKGGETFLSAFSSLREKKESTRAKGI